MLDRLARRVLGRQSNGLDGRAGDVGAVSSLDPQFGALTERLFGRSLSRQWLSDVRFAAVALALDGLVTQLDAPRLRDSIERARGVLDDRQTLTVLQLASVAGLHSVSTGAPVVVEEWEAFAGEVPLVGAAAAAKEEFETAGPRPRRLDAMYASILKLDVDYFEDFRAWIDHPWRSGALDHGTLHLVCIALDVACTHLYESGLRRHVREAFACGVSPQEILEVMQMASTEGLRTIFTAAPLLAAEVPLERDEVAERPENRAVGSGPSSL